MPYNLFIGLSREVLEQALRDAQTEALTGRSNLSGTLREVSYADAMTIGPADRVKLILAALNLIDPEDYPLESVSAPTFTVASYCGPQ